MKNDFFLGEVFLATFLTVFFTVFLAVFGFATVFFSPVALSARNLLSWLLRRAALFFLRIFPLAAISIDEYAAARVAGVGLARNASESVFILDFTRELITVFRLLTRSAFFAFFKIGIVSYILYFRLLFWSLLL